MAEREGVSAVVESLERQNEALRHALAREAMRRESYRSMLEALVRAVPGGASGSGAELAGVVAQAKEVLAWSPPQ